MVIIGSSSRSPVSARVKRNMMNAKARFVRRSRSSIQEPVVPAGHGHEVVVRLRRGGVDANELLLVRGASLGARPGVARPSFVGVVRTRARSSSASGSTRAGAGGARGCPRACPPGRPWSGRSAMSSAPAARLGGCASPRPPESWIWCSSRHTRRKLGSAGTTPPRDAPWFFRPLIEATAAYSAVARAFAREGAKLGGSRPARRDHATDP